MQGLTFIGIDRIVQNAQRLIISVLLHKKKIQKALKTFFVPKSFKNYGSIRRNSNPGWSNLKNVFQKNVLE